jgi:Rod binding domain-containing protein
VDKLPIPEGLSATSSLIAAPAITADGADLLETARAFESVFISQMLAHSGLGKALSANGGFGGEAFSSLLVDEYASKLVARGGFGLAEKVYEQLRERGASNAKRALA